MLKAIQNPINILNINNAKTKCAEIHYITSNFIILCLVCKEICNEYHVFLEHFHDQHSEEFIKNTQITDFNSKNDPLQVRPQPLQNPAAVVPVKVEHLDRVGQQDQRLTQTLIDEELPDEYGKLVYCKIEQEQYTDNFDSSLHNTSVNKSLELEDTQSLANNDQEEISNEVDWSHSFPPTLLKLNQKRPYKPRNQPNACSYCGKTFQRRYQLDTHLNIHTGLKPHQCDVCGRQFRAITTLQRHLTTHEKRQTFFCKYCSKEFNHRAAFVSHETRHTQERRVPCDDCGKLFYTRNQLDTHKRKLHNKLDDNSLPFICELCPKRYRSASMLSTHKFKKHYKSAKYACEQCGKKFVEENQLTSHMIIHVKKS